MSETEALKALGAFPVVQAAVAILVILAGIWMVLRGSRDQRPEKQETIPQWLMMGPAHDAISAIHDMNEQSRQQVDLLERIDVGVQACKTALELIRNESRLR
jgi:hypothetical protein